MDKNTAPKIKVSDALDVFGTKRALARALGVSEPAVWKWGDYLPPLRAFQLREMRPEIFDNERQAGTNDAL